MGDLDLLFLLSIDPLLVLLFFDLLLGLLDLLLLPGDL